MTRRKRERELEATHIRNQHRTSFLIPNLLRNPIQPLLHHHTQQRRPSSVRIQNPSSVHDGFRMGVSSVGREEGREVREVGKDVGVWEREDGEELRMENESNRIDMMGRKKDSRRDRSARAKEERTRGGGEEMDSTRLTWYECNPIPIDPTTRIAETASIPAVSNLASPKGNFFEGGLRDMLLRQTKQTKTNGTISPLSLLSLPFPSLPLPLFHLQDRGSQQDNSLAKQCNEITQQIGS